MIEDLLPGFITTSEATARFGYSREYLRQLLRAGRVRGRKVGLQWFVLAADLEAHQAEMERLGTAKYDPTRRKGGV